MIRWPPARFYWQPSPAKCGLRCLGYDSNGIRRFRPFPLTIVIYFVRFFLVLVLILFIGKEKQLREANRAPSTLPFFETPKVCGLLVRNSTGADNATVALKVGIRTAGSGIFEQMGNGTRRMRGKRGREGQKPQHLHRRELVYSVNFESEEIAREDDHVVVAHCGDCGKCSNAHDVRLYDETKNTLKDTATMCALKSLFWGRRAAYKCLAEDVGFTSECEECWVENIMCDIRKCLWLCAWNSMFARVHPETSEGKKELNPCTHCDEKRCGPAFMKCAGANRRRAGIISDIERDFDQEVCSAVDDGWWMDDTLLQN